MGISQKSSDLRQDCRQVNKNYREGRNRLSNHENTNAIPVVEGMWIYKNDEPEKNVPDAMGPM